MKKESINSAGLIELVKSIIGLFDKAMRSAGSSVDKKEEREDGSALYRITTARGNVLIMHVVPNDRDNKFIDIRIKPDSDNRVKEYTAVPNKESEINKYLAKAEVDLFGKGSACFIIHLGDSDDPDNSESIQVRLTPSGDSWEHVDAEFSLVGDDDVSTLKNQDTSKVLDESRKLSMAWATRAVEKLFDSDLAIEFIEPVEDNATFDAKWSTIDKDDDYGGVNMESVEQSRTIRVGLKKNVTSGEAVVNKIAVLANYEPSAALSDLNCVLVDPEFVAELPESETWYTITSDPESLNICEDVSPDSWVEEAFEAILASMMKVKIDTFCLLTQCKHNPEMSVACNDIRWMCEDYLSTFAEMCVEFTGAMLDPTQLCALVTSLDADCTNVSEVLRSDIVDLGAAIELYYCNFNHDVQKVMDDLLRRCNHMVDYVLK